MLSKCANPHCSNTFRYLNEGKLYLLDAGLARVTPSGSMRPGEVRRPPKYAWLCSTCCRHMAIRYDRELDAIVVGRSEPLQNRGSGTGG